jgi:hypothetical protein
MKLLMLTAVAGAATGLGLIAVPSVVARLLFGAELDGLAVTVARVAGIALLSLGLACWPGRTSSLAAIIGTIVYNLLAAAYLAYLGIVGERVGVLLWPGRGTAHNFVAAPGTRVVCGTYGGARCARWLTSRSRINP